MTLDIDAIEARANAATPGPWGLQATHDLLRFGRKNGGGWDQYEETMPIDGDEEFIIAARQDVPALCAEVRELRAENKRLAKLAYFGEHHFPDLTYKARNEELLAALELARALAEEWAAKKYAGDLTTAVYHGCADKLAAALGEGGRP